ncbi:MAG TPA: hypothetical protein ENN67_05475, partial [Firmicutes bacterium]|nr:hypothetical protein [Bacillota bacterium]
MLEQFRFAALSGFEQLNLTQIVIGPESRDPCHSMGILRNRNRHGSGTADVVPIRGADYTVDVVNFLQYPAGNPANLQIEITDLTNWLTLGEMTLNIRLTHPFPGMGQFTGHDVKGVLVSSGSKFGIYDTDVVYSNGIDDAILLNADGYTRWQNPVEFPPDGTIFKFIPGWLGNPDIGIFKSTINGYKYFADNIGISQTVQEYFQSSINVSRRGQFTPGTANIRQYKLRFPMVAGSPSIVFQYAVIAHWVEPDNYQPNDLPGSFPPEANAHEAFYVKVIDKSILWYNNGNGGGNLKLDIEVFDWGGAHNPLGVPGEIGAIVVESLEGLIPGGYAL